MANTLTGLYQTIYTAFNVVSRELIGFIPAVSKDSRADQVTLNQPIRSPVVPKLTASDIEASNVSDTGGNRNVSFVDLNITKQRKVSFHLTAEEEKGLMAGGTGGDITMQTFAQAFRTLSNEIEGDLAALQTDAGYAYGTPGTTPFNTSDDLTDATGVMKILDDAGAPKYGRAMILNTKSVANLLGKQPSVFKVNEAGESMGRRFGALENLYGFKFGVSAEMPRHDSHATAKGTDYLVNEATGAARGAETIAVDGGAASQPANVGDIVTFAGDTTKYRLATAIGASKATSIELKTGLLFPAPNDAALAFVTADYGINMAFTMDAIHLACRVPAVPEGGDSADDRIYVTDPHSGLIYEIAVYRQYRQVSYEVGICWGVVMNKPEHVALLID